MFQTQTTIFNGIWLIVSPLDPHIFADPKSRKPKCFGSNISGSYALLSQPLTILHSPLSDSHGECINILVQLIEESNTLDDHVVGLVHVELNLGPAVAVGKTKLGFVRGT